MRDSKRLELFEKLNREHAPFINAVLWELTADVDLFAEALQYALLAFALGRWSKPVPTNITVYAMQSPAPLTAQSNNDSFWQQKAMAAMQSRPYAQSAGNLLNLYKQYLKEKRND